MKTKHYVITAILVIVVGIGGFFAGVKYHQSKTPSFRQFQDERGSQRQMGQGRAGASMIRGEIIDRDDKSITVKQSDGSTKIVLLSESTTINKAQEGKVDDLEKGVQVAVFGQENPDKSITATSIQLNPGEFRGRFDGMSQPE